jgi:PIN domain nuclease of toxin-antitoxin system
MRILLDTHIAIWWLAGDGRLHQAGREIIEAADVAYLSSVSVWEIVVKQGRGRLDLPAGFVDALLEDFDELPLRSDHALEGRSLPRFHGDPFDRMLVAQARVEGLRLMTADAAMEGDEVPVVRP